MSGSMMQQYPPGDPQMIDTIVHQLKSQGIFDQFRKECIADVDTKPAYQNLHQRVESTVSGFLAHQVWRPDLNKNQLRESLRKHIHDSGFLNLGVERIVDQVVNPKINSVLVPQVEDVVYEFIGLEKPKRRLPDFLHHPPPPLFGYHVDQQPPPADKRKDVSLTDLLPKGLDPISPDSDETKKSDDSVEDGELDEGKACDDEASPPFEHIAHVNENSVGSHMSGISGLTSPDGRHSSISFVGDKTLVMEAMPLESNNDSQLSKVSSGSRLSISFDELDKPSERPMEETRLSVDSNDRAIANEQVRHSAQFVESDSSKTSDELPSDARRESLESATFSDDSSCSAPEYETREDYSPLNSNDEHEELLFRPVGKSVEIRDTEELTVEEEEVGQKTKRVRDEISVKYEMEDKKLTKKVKEDKGSEKYQEYDVFEVKTDREKSVKNEIEVGLLKSSKKDFNTTKELENVKKEKKEVKGSKGVEEKERKVEKDLKVKTEEKEQFKKKDDSVSLKKIEKGKEIKKHDKPKVEKSMKREEKDKKAVKSEEKPVKKDEKDKSEKKDDKEQKSSKRDEKHKSEHENGSHESKRRDSSSHSAHRPKSDKDKHHQSSSSKPRTHVVGEKSSKPRSHEDGGKSSKPRSHDDGDKSSKPHSHEDMGKSSKLHSHEDGGKSSKPHSHEDGGKSSKLHSHDDGDKSSKPHSHEDGGKSSKAHSHEDGGKSSKSHSHEDGGKSSKPRSHEDGGKSSKPRRPSHEEGEKSSKSDKHATKDDKAKRDEKHKSKNGKVDKEKPSKSDDKTPKDKDRPAKEKDAAPRKSDGGVKSDRERKDSKSKGPPSDKGKDGKRRDKGGKPTDDHDKHREKRSEDRRSTDRDSNGTARDAAPGSSRPTAAGGGTATSSRQHEAKDDKNKGGKTRNDGGGNADAAGTKNEASESNKRAADGELREEYFCTDNDGKLTLKIKKPKIAANIFEVQRIIRMRRSLSKIEERRQKELRAVQEALDSASHADESRADEAPCRITEGQSQGSEVHGQAAERQPAPEEAIPATRSVDRSPRVSESDSAASEDLRGFEETYFAANQSFIDFVKRIGASRELCDIDASSVSTDDLEYLSDSEVLDAARDYSHARLPYPDVVLSSGPAGGTAALLRAAAAPAPALVRVEVVSRPPPVPAPHTPHSLPDAANTPQAVADRGSSKEMLPPARRARKPNVRYSSEDYSFEADGEELDRKSSAAAKRPAVQGKTAATKKPKFCSPHAAGVVPQPRQGVSGDGHIAVASAGKLASQVTHGVSKDSHNAGNLVSLSNPSIPEVNHNGLPEASARLNGTEATGHARERRGGSASPPARLALGPSRRVGLTRPAAAAMTRVAVLELSRVATPPNADFVMPLSPESDVSASSGEQGAAKKGAVTPPLQPKAEGEGIATAGKRNQRSAASKAQRYSSDDLYKPRPLFNRPTRRARGSSPGVDPETTSDCVAQRNAVTVDSQPQIPKRER